MLVNDAYAVINNYGISPFHHAWKLNNIFYEYISCQTNDLAPHKLLFD